MRTIRDKYVGWMVAGFLLAWFPCVAAPSAPEPTENDGGTELVLPSEMCRGLFIVPVTFGEGEGTTLELLLDTGASWTFLDPGALRRIAGGNTRARKVSINGSRIGRHELSPLRAYVLSMNKLSLAVGRHIDGILGFPAFRDVLLTLDYPAEEIRVSEGTLPPPDGLEISRTSGKRPNLRIAIGKRQLDVLVDSGYTGRFQLKPSDRLAWSAEPRPATSSVVAGGLVVNEGGRLSGAIQFGPLEFDDPIVILGKGKRLAGWHVLRHFVLTFDQKKKRMRTRAATAGPVPMDPLVGTGLAYDPSPEGLKIVRVSAASSVEATGLRKGDLIVAIDGLPVHPRGCGDPRSNILGQRQVFSYIRDGVRAETTIETVVIVP